MENWKLPLIIAVVFIFTFGLTGCQKGGNRIKNEHKTDYSILINFGQSLYIPLKMKKLEYGIFQRRKGLLQD